jgi:hypothetical protein
MPTQEFGPFVFDAPTDWSRRTVIVFVGAGKDAATPPNIVVTRDDRGPGEDLLAHAWRKVFEMARALPRFELLGSRESRVDGQAAFKVIARWSSEGGPVTQGLAWVDGPDGAALAVTCTAIEQPDAFDELERVLDSVRVGGAPRESMVVPSAAARPSTPSPSVRPPASDDGPAYSPVPMPGARPARR